MVKEKPLFVIYAKSYKSAMRQARHTDRGIYPNYVITRLEYLGPSRKAKGKNRYFAYGHKRIKKVDERR